MNENDLSGHETLFEDESPKLKQAKIYFEKAKELHKKGETETALKLLDKSLTCDPTNIGYYSVKIMWYRQLKKPREVLKVYDDLINMDPNDPSLYRYKAEYLINTLKNNKMALDVINRGLVIDPKNEALLIRKVEILRCLGEMNALVSSSKLTRDWLEYIRVSVSEEIPSAIYSEKKYWGKFESSKTERVFVWAMVGKNIITLYMGLDPNTEPDVERGSSQWPRFKSVFRIDSEGKLDRAIEIITQAYNYDLIS